MTTRTEPGAAVPELLDRTPENAFARYVMAHGAGAGMRHPFMEGMAEALFARGVATTRFEFPYMAEGRKRIDARAVLERTIVAAVAAARDELPLFVGGKSMGGRIASHLALDVRGLVFLGFPLHPANRPSSDRAAHLRDVKVPMLFLQGSRDALCALTRLRPILRKLPNAQLRVIRGADHAFSLRKRDGRDTRDVFAELADAIVAFCR